MVKGMWLFFIFLLLASESGFSQQSTDVEIPNTGLSVQHFAEKVGLPSKYIVTKVLSQDITEVTLDISDPKYLPLSLVTNARFLGVTSADKAKKSYQWVVKTTGFLTLTIDRQNKKVSMTSNSSDVIFSNNCFTFFLETTPDGFDSESRYARFIPYPKTEKIICDESVTYNISFKSKKTNKNVPLRLFNENTRLSAARPTYEIKTKGFNFISENNKPPLFEKDIGPKISSYFKINSISFAEDKDWVVGDIYYHRERFPKSLFKYATCYEIKQVDEYDIFSPRTESHSTVDLNPTTKDSDRVSISLHPRHSWDVFIHELAHTIHRSLGDDSFSSAWVSIKGQESYEAAKDQLRSPENITLWADSTLDSSSPAFGFSDAYGSINLLEDVASMTQQLYLHFEKSYWSVYLNDRKYGAVYKNKIKLLYQYGFLDNTRYHAWVKTLK